MKLLLLLLTLIACSSAEEETTTEVTTTETTTEVIEELSTDGSTTATATPDPNTEGTTNNEGIGSYQAEANVEAPKADLLACGCVHPRPGQSCPYRTLPSTNAVGYITAGLTTKRPGDFPWMALMGMREDKDSFQWFCGGALITDRHVLTAAHCLDDAPEVRMDVARLGEHDHSTTNDTSGTVDMDVKEVYLHPDYKKPVIYHDIAIVRLAKKVAFTKTIQPICLPPLQGIPPSSLPIKISVMGWGHTKSGGVASNILLYADLEMVPPKKCKKDYEKHPETHPRGILAEMLCAAGTSGQDTCQGDSGGPLVRLDKNADTGDDQYTVFGVVSGGDGCGDATLPGLYTDVQSYLPWILKRLE